MDQTLFIDFTVIVIVALLANVVFNNFDRHLPLWRRALKFSILMIALIAVGLLFGRVILWSLIGVMTIGQVVLHAWWFPRHGINGLTAEPREKYLALIKKMKGKDT